MTGLDTERQWNLWSAWSELGKIDPLAYEWRPLFDIHEGIKDPKDRVFMGILNDLAVL